MMRPDNCPDILFELMSECWHTLPDERPTFLQICKRLEGKGNDRWRETCYFLTQEGREAMINQEEMLQVRKCLIYPELTTGLSIECEGWRRHS